MFPLHFHLPYQRTTSGSNLVIHNLEIWGSQCPDGNSWAGSLKLPCSYCFCPLDGRVLVNSLHGSKAQVMQLGCQWLWKAGEWAAHCTVVFSASVVPSCLIWYFSSIAGKKAVLLLVMIPAPNPGKYLATFSLTILTSFLSPIRVGNFVAHTLVSYIGL